MRYFLDTEFIENGPRKPIQLISIGIVAEDGREFYMVSREFNPDDASDWVKQNVLSQIPLGTRHYELKEIREAIKLWMVHDKPEFWGYYADYDWVVFCQIFGAMIDLPKGWPMYCRDLKQWSDSINAPKFAAPKGEHNALEDAKWNKQLYAYLAERQAQASEGPKS